MSEDVGVRVEPWDEALERAEKVDAVERAAAEAEDRRHGRRDVLDWEDLLERAALAPRTLVFGGWRGKFAHARWCEVIADDTSTGWQGTLHQEPSIDGRRIRVDLSRPYRAGFDCSYTEAKADRVGAELLAEEWAQQLVDTLADRPL